MLHKLSLDANSMVIIQLSRIGIGVCNYIFIWQVNIARIPYT